MPPVLIHHVNRQAFIQAVIDDVSTALQAAIVRTGAATLAVPAGRTMARLLPELTARPLPWPQITVSLVDERWVPSNHADSNEAAIRAAFVAARGVRIQGQFRPGIAAEDAVAWQNANSPPPDVILLAMASDGHIGSLFPHDPVNNAQTRYAIVNHADHARITLTPTGLAAAGTTVLAVDSADKAALLERALRHGPPEELPVRHVLRHGVRVHICAL
jgi:6-phosphogluconolactonase